MPGVGPLKDNHARIAPQLPRKLAVSDVDRIDPLCAAREKDVGEAARRCPHIQRDRAGHVPSEVIETARQLHPATAHPGMVAALDDKACIFGQCLAGLGDTAVAHIDQPTSEEPTSYLQSLLLHSSSLFCLNK